MARSAWHGFIVAALSGFLIAGTAIADDSPLPERRLSLMANTGYRYYANHLHTHYNCDWIIGQRERPAVA